MKDTREAEGVKKKAKARKVAPRALILHELAHKESRERKERAKAK